MQATNENIAKRLLRLEAMAKALSQECYQTRQLIEGGVSTPTKSQPLTDEQLAEVSAKRWVRLHKSK